MTTERRNITAPPDWWSAFEAAAEAEGRTLSEWLREAGRNRLPKRMARSLSEPRSRGGDMKGGRE